MPTENKPTSTTDNNGNPVAPVNPEPPKTNQPIPPQSTSANQPPPTSDPNPPKEVFTSEQLAERLAKARQEEKDKLYPELKKAKDALAALEKSKAKWEQTQAELQREIDGLRSGQQSEAASLTQELAKSRDQISKLELAIEEVATQSTEQIRQSDLRRFRVEQIAKAGLKHLADTVTGNSEQEILASIKTAKEKEEAIEKEATERVRQEMGQNVPTPLAPSGSSTNHSTVNPMDKEALAKLPEEKYKARRAELLAEAKRKSGLV